MRVTRILALIAAMVIILTAPALAVDVESAQSEVLELDELESAMPDEARDILGDVSVADSLSFNAMLSRVYEAAGDMLGGIVKRAVKSAGLIVVTVLLMSLAGSMSAGEGAPDYVVLGGVIAISAVVAGDAKAFIGQGAETLATLNDFSKILLPSLSAAAAASGAVTSAAAKYAATALFMDVLITFGLNVIMPLIYAYIAAVIANAAIGGSALQGACSFLKWLCTTALTVFVIAFTAYISITGVISGAADEVAVRAAKTALSAALPVVGGIVSDAAGTLTAGAGILRNSIGVFGLIAVLCVCLGPFLTLGAQYLIYKAAAGVASAFADSRVSGLISGMGTAFGMALSLVGVGAVLLFVSIISSMKAVSF